MSVVSSAILQARHAAETCRVQGVKVESCVARWGVSDPRGGLVNCCFFFLFLSPSPRSNSKQYTTVIRESNRHGVIGKDPDGDFMNGPRTLGPDVSGLRPFLFFSRAYRGLRDSRSCMQVYTVRCLRQCSVSVALRTPT